MIAADYEKRMRQFETFHGLTLMPETWTVIRVDGRGFSRYTAAKKFKKPFDDIFCNYMITTARRLMEDLGGIYAWTCSDEISVLFPPDWQLFNREVEKIVSISAGIASSTFTSVSGDIVQFDSRVWSGPNKGAVVDYFRWRQDDAFRCCLNGWCYWTMIDAYKFSKAQAASKMFNQGVDWKMNLLHSFGLNFEKDCPAWQKRGIGVHWARYAKLGKNPKTGEETIAQRRRLENDLELPSKDKYGLYLFKMIADATKEREKADKKAKPKTKVNV